MAETTTSKVEQFLWWLTMKGGKPSYIYHVGFLPLNRTHTFYDLKLVRGIPTEVPTFSIPNEIGELAAVVWDQYKRGRVLLTQRKLGLGKYEYIATKRKGRKA